MFINYHIVEARTTQIPDQVGINKRMLSCEVDHESDYHMASYKGEVSDDKNIRIDIYRGDEEADEFQIRAVLYENEGPGTEVIEDKLVEGSALTDTLAEIFEKVEQETKPIKSDGDLKVRLHKIIDALL